MENRVGYVAEPSLFADVGVLLLEESNVKFRNFSHPLVAWEKSNVEEG